ASTRPGRAHPSCRSWRPPQAGVAPCEVRDPVRTAASLVTILALPGVGGAPTSQCPVERLRELKPLPGREALRVPQEGNRLPKQAFQHYVLPPGVRDRDPKRLR